VTELHQAKPGDLAGQTATTCCWTDPRLFVVCPTQHLPP
jgi:hypothetical protein